MVRRWTTGLILSALLVALSMVTGCASRGGHRAAPVARATSRAARSFAPRPVPPSLSSVATQIRSGLYPACRDAVGLPTEFVVHGHNVTTGAPEVRCVTGAGDDDSTDVVSARCGSGRFAGAALYYWAARDPTAPDQRVYAGHAGGIVVVVPRLVAVDVWRHALLTAVATAAGC